MKENGNGYNGMAEHLSGDKSKMQVAKKPSKLDVQGDVKGKEAASYAKAGIQDQKKQAGS